MELYSIFKGDELKIAELIQRRRLQMLVHSYLYYDQDISLIDDHTFDKWGFELADLQKRYPNIAKQVCYDSFFQDFDGSTGAFLPYRLAEIRSIGNRLAGIHTEEMTQKVTPKPVEPKPKTSARRRLF